MLQSTKTNTRGKMIRQLAHEALESLAEDAEDFLNDAGVTVTSASHSYEDIIEQAENYVFRYEF